MYLHKNSAKGSDLCQGMLIRAFIYLDALSICFYYLLNMLRIIRLGLPCF